MANIRQLKRRIKTAQNTSKITKAMEMVAASKMIKAQNQALEARPYSEALFGSLQTVAKHTESSLHPLLSTNTTGKQILVVMATDKGLCGSLNTNLLKAMMDWQTAHPQGEVVAIGKKAVHSAQLVGIPVFAQFTELPERITTGEILPLSKLLIDNYLDHQLRSVDILFTDFINTLSQKATFKQLLPLSQEDPYHTDDMITPEVSSEYTFEPSTRDLLEHLLPLYIEQTIYHLMLEARASEHSARMVAMKNASENAAELMDELKLVFNKSRQAAITAELLDMIGATLSLETN
jgi:F-type H+-transporting ATPase subunit gamma